MEDKLVINQEDCQYTAVLCQVCGEENYGGFRNLRRRAKYNGYALTKQVLVDAVKRYVSDKKRQFPKVRFPKPDIVLSLTIDSCGSTVNYKTFDDIPSQDVPCPCGNPNHWMIRYRDLRGKEVHNATDKD